jgi:hypothetical protein
MPFTCNMLQITSFAKGRNLGKYYGHNQVIFVKQICRQYSDKNIALELWMCFSLWLSHLWAAIDQLMLSSFISKCFWHCIWCSFFFSLFYYFHKQSELKILQNEIPTVGSDSKLLIVTPKLRRQTPTNRLQINSSL